MTTHLDIDSIELDELRVDILRRMQEAIRPFQEQLRDLDSIERLVNRNGVETRPSTINPSVAYATRPLTTTEYKKLPNRGGRPKTKPNGHAEPKQFSKLKRFAEMHQPKAVITILTQEPGLSARDITTRMIEGGFPFKAEKPYASMIQVIGDMAKKGLLQQKTPVTRVGGQVNTYYVSQKETS